MERFNALGRGLQLMLVASVLLLISMFFTWQDFGPEIVEFNGWEGFTGVVLGLLAIAAVVWVALRLAGVAVRLPVSHAMITAALGALIVLFGVLKLLTIIDDEATVWAYVGFILALLAGVGAWLAIQQAGGMDALKSEFSSLQSSTTAGTAAPSAPSTAPPPPESPPPAPPPPPAAPAEPEAPSEPAEEPEAPYDPDAPRGA